MTTEIAVLVKWVELSGTVDPATGAYKSGGVRRGFSKSDQAALEVALKASEELGATVVVVSAAPADAERDLREFAAAGAERIKRIEVGAGSAAPIESLVAAVRNSALIVCGDLSADNGSGFVPAAIAHKMGFASALGLTDVTVNPNRSLQVVRRLQKGFREKLEITLPAVVSVEATAGSLRRAPLSSLVGDGHVPIEVVAEPNPASGHDQVEYRPWRPRTRELPSPVGDSALDRIVELTGAMVDRTPPRTVELEPQAAASAILSQLREWGYLDGNG